MKKIGIVITDGVGFRNFVLTNFLNQFKDADIFLFSYLPRSAYSKEHLNNITFIELDNFSEKKKTWFFRKVKELAHLKKLEHQNFGFYDCLNANRPQKYNLISIATRFAFIIAHLFKAEHHIKFFEKLQFKTYHTYIKYQTTLDLLKRNKVDTMFFTHQRPTFIGILIEACNTLNINTSAFIFSWDNLASKGRMAGDFQDYYVWNNLMKDELLKFYPSIKSENVFVIGTPQFEPYFDDAYKVEKTAFQNKFNIRKDLKTICFSCGDITTSKNDELYIESIMQAIQNQDIQEVNFIVRTSPAEDPKRFSELSKQYKTIIWNFPKWHLARNTHSEAWSQRVPTLEDLKDLRAMIEYSDLNINMLSTMSLDFMCHDKPVINPVFGHESNGLYNDQRFLKYEHIQIMNSFKATKIVKNKAELIEAINLYLENPKTNSLERHKLLKHHVMFPVLGTKERLVQMLLNSNQ